MEGSAMDGSAMDGMTATRQRLTASRQHDGNGKDVTAT